MANEKILNVNDADFEEKVLKNELPVLVDFWAEWCGPCRSIAPFLDSLAEDEKIDGKAVIAKVNIDNNPETPAKYGIKGIPTLILFQGGEQVDMIVGTDTVKIREIVEKVIN